ncbi:MAG TPA: DUF2786 domain-containing protein [Pseudonocardiaceae bacterium]|nr:DUF2786 domain-containing protein [Pseudonocardiaceae bacterium]
MTAVFADSVVDVARESGAAAALARLRADSVWDGVPFGPSGYAVVADSDTDRPVDAESIGESVLLARGRPTGPLPDGWTLGVLRLRLGLSERLLAACVEHLGGRGPAESPLLQRQLVQDTVADVLIGQLEIRAVLSGARHLAPPMVAWLHDSLSEVDIRALRLLGASGFTGAGRQVTISEALAAAYRPEVG